MRHITTKEWNAAIRTIERAAEGLRQLAEAYTKYYSDAIKEKQDREKRKSK